MKTKNWLWLLIAVFGWSFYACSDEEGIGYESSPDWATEGGYKVLKGINRELTKIEAWELVKKEIFNGNDTPKGVVPFISRNVIPAKTKFETIYKKTITSPKYDCWMLYIDDNPGGPLSSECRYAFVKLDGSYIKVIKEHYISDNETWDIVYRLYDKTTNSRVVFPNIFGYFTGSMNIPQTSTNAS